VSLKPKKRGAVPHKQKPQQNDSDHEEWNPTKKREKKRVKKIEKKKSEKLN
jgi:hypothetical protein